MLRHLQLTNKKMSNTFGELFLKEVEVETPATRKCLERIPESLYKWKPHERSMEMGYLAQLVAELPKWVAAIVEDGEIDFATWEKYKLTTNDDLLEYFEDNIKHAEKALKKVSDEELKEMFYLKDKGKELMKSNKKDSVSSFLNHWVHHRGQLTVYMRLNDILVPAIYGPSADDKTM
jgi:uncharacterized damage-inducible protein DinB